MPPSDTPTPSADERPADDQSKPMPGSENQRISVRLAALAPAAAQAGISATVQAIDVPDPQAPTTFRVTLQQARRGFLAVLRSSQTLPLVVTLPPGCPLPLAVGDQVRLRVLQSVASFHPRIGTEVRIDGRTVLLEGDDDFLSDLGDLQVTHGPCTDAGTARNGIAPRQAGLVRLSTAGGVGYSDERWRLRVLDLPGERVIFAGSWVGFGQGMLPADASPQIHVTLVRHRRAKAESP